VLQDSDYLLALHAVEGFGPARIKKLYDYFGSFKTAWGCRVQELKPLNFPEKLLFEFKKVRETLDPEEYLLRLKKGQINVVTLFDKNYPFLLKEISDPPLVIYFKGELSGELLANCFAVVGTRKPTSYGRVVTEKLTKELSELGLTIVSGLARGVDTVAHYATLSVGGKTIAVLGGGLNQIFPSENSRLAEKISLGNGAVMTEFPPGYPHLSGNFPARNRIISGLSKGVLVTEAAEDSGSLITAKFALEQGRDVFAVPGPITSSVSGGTAKLLKEGARVVSSVEDILDELNIRLSLIRQVDPISLNKDELQILEIIADEPRHIDEISRILKRSVGDISGSLLKMEISGAVKSLGGGKYIKS
jgi:DNA processing protein